MSSLRDIDRRDSLKLLAAAMAGLVARCGKPQEEIIPYVNMPEGMVAGEPERFATTLPLAGYGRGFQAIAVDGRPIKIEGNVRHPFSLGATDVFAESEVLSLYDPDRSQTVFRRDQISTWDDFAQAWSRIPPTARLGLVTGRILSPTTLARITALKARYPNLSWYRYEPVQDDAARAGARLAFGRTVSALPRLAEADRIVCLGADPLGMGPRLLANARAFSIRRHGQARQQLYVAESAWSLSGACADFRLAARPEELTEIGRAIANQLGAQLGEPHLPNPAGDFAARAGRALRAAKSRAIILAGDQAPAELHGLCHWMNHALAAPVSFISDVDTVEQDHGAALTALANDLHSHKLDALLILDANPVYDAPDSFGMAQAISHVPFSAHLGLYRSETAAATGWHLPQSHVLESWGDARAPDGTASLIQPLIRPLFDSRTADEFLATLAGEKFRKAYDLTRAQWQQSVSADFEHWWRDVLGEGVIRGSAASTIILPNPKLPTLPPPEKPGGLTLVLSPHATLWDGRFANNAWLQECPQPFTKQVWGNAAQLAPEDAGPLGIKDGDTIALEVAGKVIPTPAVVMAGQAAGVVALHLGMGRLDGGGIGKDVGIRFAGLGAQALVRQISGAQLRPAEMVLPFHSTQNNTRLSGRTEELFPIATAGAVVPPKEQTPPSLLPVPGTGDYAWAMVVDTDACIGCNACVVACQAENNVPIIGPEEIAQGRDMHWLRVDAYAREDAGRQRRGFQPVPCMHCELAPCEPVCPVEASVHDHQGLNVQVYNRCIGTRFCEANCPYKVRRFNWFAYAGEQAYGDLKSAFKAQHNPDVSSRGRGVMEKCNYCLQRIVRARRTAEKEGRTVGEGEMVTACQAACPTRAIHFGDKNQPRSDVAQLRQDPRRYDLLAELNTRPRTTYLKRLYAEEEEG